MDADCNERRRARITSHRASCWSMYSQRLEEIVAELMKPISDIRQSFDTDLSALLEEYLTEAGLHALDAEEERAGSPAEREERAPPNFAELALVVQHSVSLYSRKVDYLYQHVLDVSEALHSAALERDTSREEEESGSTPRRRRRPTGAGDFEHIQLEAREGARRGESPARPPPTLPRLYLELEPRVLTAADEPLRDYEGEAVGLLSDYHAAWRLRGGLLVDELEDAAGGAARLLPISLLELQAALAAAAPASPPALRDFSPPPLASTPLPPDSPPPPPRAPPLPLPACEVMPPPARRDRKRRNELAPIELHNKLHICDEIRARLAVQRDFGIEKNWIRVVIDKRTPQVLELKRRLIEPRGEFRGFEFSDEAGGFAGWSAAEAAAARAAAVRSAPALSDSEDDDDGFFEQSSVGESDLSAASSGGAEWAARVAARAAGGGRAPDMRELTGRVLAACAGPAPAPFPELLRRTAREPHDVSRLLLASLFLANAGNVEVLRGPPLSVDSFSLRLVSADERGAAAAATDEGLLAPT